MNDNKVIIFDEDDQISTNLKGFKLTSNVHNSKELVWFPLFNMEQVRLIQMARSCYCQMDAVSDKMNMHQEPIEFEYAIDNLRLCFDSSVSDRLKAALMITSGVIALVLKHIDLNETIDFILPANILSDSEQWNNQERE